MRSMEMSAKTVEAAVQAACEALGVDRDDINVSYEVLEFPTRKLFKTIPAKVLVKVEEPEAAPAPAAEEKPAEVSTKPAEVVEISDETAPEIEKAVVEDMVEAAELAPVAEDDVEIPLDIAADPRLQAAVDYLTPIFNLMGVENFSFTAVKKGAATILKVSGEHMGALIGRRGETLDAIQDPISLYEPVFHDDGDALYVMDQIRDEKNTHEDWLQHIALGEAMEQLDEREQKILQLRFFKGKTQMEVSEEIHISQAQVSRIEKAALKEMRKWL